jgi:glycosyltransferase involved in cell wall biosynthesis
MNLNLMTPVGPTGYGIAGYHIFKALSQRGVKIAFFPIADNRLVPWGDAAAVAEAQRNAVFYDPRATCLKIAHQYLLAERVGKGSFVAFPFFELDPLAPMDVHHLNCTDGVFVASQWAKNVCQRSGVTVPISVVPLGVDRAVFFPAVTQPTCPQPCVFLNVGKWEARKGHEVLLKAFNATFTPADRVELWMMPDHYPLPAPEREAWHHLYLRSKLGAAGKIIIRPPVATHVELADIMRKATCGVFPSFAEGFNLELLEMMACGKPVIATNYAAHTEYCNATNSWLIEGSEIVPAYGGKWFTGQGRWLAWGDLQTDQLCAHLRHIYQLSQSGPLLNQDGIETANRLSWDHTAQKIIGIALA